jgi:hypothetical protein
MNIEECGKAWRDCRSCRLSDNLSGWGCRFLLVAPDVLPTTEYEKAKLFSKVYSEAENLGILDCPHFISTKIDEALENEHELVEIMEIFARNCQKIVGAKSEIQSSNSKSNR